LPRPFRTFAYPLPPLIYLALTAWTLCFVMINKPVEALFGVGIIASGLAFYWLTTKMGERVLTPGKTSQL
jgi:APA family basic amino acid/polyamine antiporter